MSFVARTNKFDKGVKNLERRIKKFAKAIKSAALRVVKFGAALTAVAVGGMTLLVKSAFKSIDATSKLADRLNITTEALVGLQHGASIYGVEQESLNKALEQFVRRLGEAQSMGGETKDALDRLGLSAADLAAVPLDKAVGKVFDTIRKLTDATIQADAAYRLFGRSGIKLINFASAGSAGIKEMADEARHLGKTFTRLAGFGVEKANDAITKLNAKMRGVANQLAIGLAPVVEGMADRFRNMGLSGKDMALAIVSAMEHAAIAVTVLAKTLTILPLAIRTVQLAAQSFMQKQASQFSKVAGIMGLVLGKSLGGGALTAASQRSQEFAGAKSDAIGLLEDEIARLNKGLDKTLGATVREFAKMKDAIKGIGLPFRFPLRGGQIDVADVAEIAAKAVSDSGRDRFAGSRVISSLRDVIPGGGGGAKKQNVIDEEAKRQRDEMLRIWREIVRSKNALFVPAGP